MSLCKRQWKTEKKAEKDWVMHIMGVKQETHHVVGCLVVESYLQSQALSLSLSILIVIH